MTSSSIPAFIPAFRAIPAFAVALALGACATSTTPAEEVTPTAERLVDECLATGFAAVVEGSEADGTLTVSANYPLVSPDYVLEYYVTDIEVVVDETFDARVTTTDWGAEGLLEAVFGRAEGELAWRVLTDPDAECPPLPEGQDWPSF